MVTRKHLNRPAHNRVDLVGKRFGKVLVLSDTGKRKTRKPIYLCQCDCGNNVELLGKYLTNGDTKSCGCYAKGNAHNRDVFEEITASFWNNIVRQAKRRGIPFEVTRNQAWSLFINQNRLCNLSGEPITFTSNMRDFRKDQTASLDRIDNSKGYTFENVQWVHKVVNIMKNVHSNEDLLKWCVSICDWMRNNPDKAHKSIGFGLPKVHTPKEEVISFMR